MGLRFFVECSINSFVAEDRGLCSWFGGALSCGGWVAIRVKARCVPLAHVGKVYTVKHAARPFVARLDGVTLLVFFLAREGCTRRDRAYI